ncbi:MAG: zinc ribbon domain-containing protein, partial [Bacteroidetes bacterium]|nr:zinc ribbon domain-containing protein [Bacteroidota bacterium]
MAVARILCGECGEEISSSDALCPHCKTEVELPGASGGESGLHCEVCGELSQRGAKVCGACGARLPDSGAAHARGKRRRSARRSVAAGGSKGKAQARRTFEPWQIVSGVAVLVLVAYFIYSEVSREQGAVERRVDQAEAVPGQMSADI